MQPDAGISQPAELHRRHRLRARCRDCRSIRHSGSPQAGLPYEYWELWPAPVHNSALNHMYYNPRLTYDPPVYSDASSYPQMDAGNTSNWTKVRADPFTTADPLDCSSEPCVDLTANVIVGQWCNSDWTQGNDDSGLPFVTNPGHCRVNGLVAAASAGAPAALGDYMYPWAPTGITPNDVYDQSRHRRTISNVAPVRPMRPSRPHGPARRTRSISTKTTTSCGATSQPGLARHHVESPDPDLRHVRAGTDLQRLPWHGNVFRDGDGYLQRLHPRHLQYGQRKLRRLYGGQLAIPPTASAPATWRSVQHRQRQLQQHRGDLQPCQRQLQQHVGTCNTGNGVCAGSAAGVCNLTNGACNGAGTCSANGNCAGFRRGVAGRGYCGAATSARPRKPASAAPPPACNGIVFPDMQRRHAEDLQSTWRSDLQRRRVRKPALTSSKSRPIRRPAPRPGFPPVATSTPIPEGTCVYRPPARRRRCRQLQHADAARSARPTRTARSSTAPAASTSKQLRHQQRLHRAQILPGTTTVCAVNADCGFVAGTAPAARTARPAPTLPIAPRARGTVTIRPPVAWRTAFAMRTPIARLSRTIARPRPARPAARSAPIRQLSARPEQRDLSVLEPSGGSCTTTADCTNKCQNSLRLGNTCANNSAKCRVRVLPGSRTPLRTATDCNKNGAAPQASTRARRRNGANASCGRSQVLGRAAQHDDLHHRAATGRHCQTGTNTGAAAPDRRPGGLRPDRQMQRRTAQHDDLHRQRPVQHDGDCTSVPTRGHVHGERRQRGLWRRQQMHGRQRYRLHDQRPVQYGRDLHDRHQHRHDVHGARRQRSLWPDR